MLMSVVVLVNLLPVRGAPSMFRLAGSPNILGAHDFPYYRITHQTRYAPIRHWPIIGRLIIGA